MGAASKGAPTVATGSAGETPASASGDDGVLGAGCDEDPGAPEGSSTRSVAGCAHEAVASAAAVAKPDTVNTKLFDRRRMRAHGATHMPSAATQETS